MNILLADDERMVRLSLESMIEELYPDTHCFYHARNGNEMLTILKEQNINVAFVDIKMPLTNGLDAIASGKEFSKHTEFIILSGYADFNYAQTAISLSVHSYLLKPISLDQIRTVIDTIILQKNELSRNEIRSFRHKIAYLYYQLDNSQPIDKEDEDTTKQPLELYQFYIHNYEIESTHLYKTVTDILTNLCDQTEYITEYSIFLTSRNELCLITSPHNHQRFQHSIQRVLATYNMNHIIYFHTMGSTLLELYNSSKLITKYSILYLICNTNTFLQLEPLLTSSSLNENLSFCEYIFKIQTYYNKNHLTSYKRCINELKSKTNYQRLYENISKEGFLYHCNHFFQTDLPDGSLVNLLDALLQCWPHNIKAALQTKDDLVSIQDYIHQNYKEDISITTVSEHFHISPTYLSKLFHEKTGQKFIDFVIEVRMENAKKLLHNNPNLTITQVSEMVGYSSVRHFSKTFKRHTGMLPSAFINKDQLV